MMGRLSLVGSLPLLKPSSLSVTSMVLFALGVCRERVIHGESNTKQKRNIHGVHNILLSCHKQCLPSPYFSCLSLSHFLF